MPGQTGQITSQNNDIISDIITNDVSGLVNRVGDVIVDIIGSDDRVPVGLDPGHMRDTCEAWGWVGPRVGCDRVDPHQNTRILRS